MIDNFVFYFYFISEFLNIFIVMKLIGVNAAVAFLLCSKDMYINA